MKKFSFNLKFLDRFKKSKNDSKTIDTSKDSDEFEEIDIDLPEARKSSGNFNEDDSEDDSENDFNEEDRTLPEIPALQDLNFDPFAELDSILKNKSAENDIKPVNSADAENHAEKTLNSFNLEKFREAHKHLENDYTESDMTNPNLVFQEMGSPHSANEQTTEKTKMKFSFPEFKFPKWSLRKENKDPEEKSPATGNNKNFKNPFVFNNSSWNEIVITFFSPGLRPRIHAVFLICFLSLVSYFLGKGLGQFLAKTDVTKIAVKKPYTPPVKEENFNNDINKIAQTNLFNIKASENFKEIVSPKNIQNIICNDSDKPSAEGLKLLDTIVLQDSVKSVASVQVRGQADLLNVREGEQLTGSLEVSRIARLRVILKNLSTGECEYISAEDLSDEIPQTMKIYPASMAKSIFKTNAQGIKNEGNTFKIKKTYRDQMIGNMSEVLSQAKAVQMTNPDGSLSFKMTEVVPGSIYSQLNIQNDDIITNINGKKIENLNELMSLLGRIKEIDHFQIGLRRNGINENLEYNFE